MRGAGDTQVGGEGGSEVKREREKVLEQRVKEDTTKGNRETQKRGLPPLSGRDK